MPPTLGNITVFSINTGNVAVWPCVDCLVCLFVGLGEKVRHTYTLDLLCQSVTPTPVVIILLHMVFGGLSRRTKRLLMTINKDSKSNLLIYAGVSEDNICLGSHVLL